MPTAAVILPPREGFGPGRTGAIGMLVRRLAQAPGWTTVILGGKQDGPVFPGLDYQPVTPKLWPPGSTNLRYAAALADALRKLKPDLIEVHNRPEIALALIARLPGIPVVQFLHNDPQGMREATTPAERTALLLRCALVLTPSQYLQDRLLDGIAAPPRLPAILPNCLDFKELPSPQPRSRTILFAGRVVEDKAPDAFVAACAAALPFLDGWWAEIIGADRFGHNSPDTPYVMATRAAAEAATIRVLGYRDHPEVLAAMQRAAIVVVPSRWPEPFGLVALEAMACGAALICSPRGALREVAGDAAIFADPDRPQDIASAIRLLANDNRRRAELAQAGQRRAQQFAAPLIAAQLADLRWKLIAG